MFESRGVCIRHTARAAGVRIHEGEGHPFILLQGALVCEAALHGAHMALLLPVGDGRLIHVPRFPGYRSGNESRTDEEGGETPCLVRNCTGIIKRKEEKERLCTQTTAPLFRLSDSRLAARADACHRWSRK